MSDLNKYYKIIKSVSITLYNNTYIIHPYCNDPMSDMSRAHNPFLFLKMDCILEDFVENLRIALDISNYESRYNDFPEGTKGYIKAMKVKSLRDLYSNGRGCDLALKENNFFEIYPYKIGEKNRGLAYVITSLGKSYIESYSMETDLKIIAERIRYHLSKDYNVEKVVE